MAAETLEPAIRAWVLDELGWRADPTEVKVTRLHGGYSWRTYRVDGDATVAVRVAPEGGTVEPYDPAREAPVLAGATSAGLPVAELLAVDHGFRFSTSAAIHSWLHGDVIGPRDTPDPADRDRFRDAFATALGLIHRELAADPITVAESYERVLGTEQGIYRRYAPCAHPGFEIGARWLELNQPRDPRPAARVHGDYRLSNLLWTAPGELSGILDWERSDTLDPMADVAFTRLFSGWCAIDESAVDRYAAVSGVTVDETRVAYASRFERWRSFTAAMRGFDALAAARNDDARLLRIGLAGEAGAWAFLALLPEIERDGPAVRHDRWSYRSLVRGRVGDTWPSVATADAEARDVALAELEAVDRWPALTAALAEKDPERSYGLAHEAVIARMNRPGGFSAPEVGPALRAVATRATLRLDKLETTGWD